MAHRLRMTYEIVDTDSGDVLAAYGSSGEARQHLGELLSDHAELTEDMAIIQIDERGHRVGDPTWASSLPGVHGAVSA